MANAPSLYSVAPVGGTAPTAELLGTTRLLTALSCCKVSGNLTRRAHRSRRQALPRSRYPRCASLLKVHSWIRVPELYSQLHTPTDSSIASCSKVVSFKTRLGRRFGEEAETACKEQRENSPFSRTVSDLTSRIPIPDKP